MAVGRFVAVGEAIAAENQELKDEMGQACFEARRAGKPPHPHTHTLLGLLANVKHGSMLKHASDANTSASTLTSASVC